jgi:transposase-like protein
MAQKETMTQIEFMQKYSTEKACEEQLFKMKWPNGFVCDKCGAAREPYVTNTRRLKLYQCKECGHQTTVTVNTVLEHSYTDLTKWFLAIYMASNDKRGVSAAQVARSTGVSYPTAWLMLHKIRAAMSDRDSVYQLKGLIELDDGYVGGPAKGKKRGRGTDKIKIMVAVSTDDGKPAHAKIESIPNVQSDTVVGFALRNIATGSAISSDAFSSYAKLIDHFDHRPDVFGESGHGDFLKWAHIVISNLKTFIEGTYHGLDSKHIQRYLDEFCYRFNRRMFAGQGFLRLLDCCANSKTITYCHLTEEL